jgi:Protein of unknown function (DUF2818)
MGQSGAVWAVLVLAILGANLPFLNDRLFAVFALSQPKSLVLRLVELVLMYFVVGGVGLWLEQRAGQIAAQGWEFYAITGALFITLAFPGFVYRYLLRRNS